MGKRLLTILICVLLASGMISCQGSEKEILDCAQANIDTSFSITPRGTSNSVPIVVDFAFSGKYESGMRFDWDFGDGGQSQSKTPSHVYQRKGVYHVKLYVTKTITGNQCSQSSIQELTIK